MFMHKKNVTPIDGLYNYIECTLDAYYGMCNCRLFTWPNPWDWNATAVKGTFSLYGQEHTIVDAVFGFKTEISQKMMLNISPALIQNITNEVLTRFRAHAIIVAGCQISKVLYSLSGEFDEDHYAGLFPFHLACESAFGDNVTRDAVSTVFRYIIVPNAPFIRSQQKQTCPGCSERLLCMFRHKTIEGTCHMAENFFPKVEKFQNLVYTK